MDATQAKQLSETRALVGQLKELLGGRVKAEGSEEGLLHDTAHEWELRILRRIDANVIADQAAPARAEVEVDAAEVADALLARLSPSIAKDVADALAARLAK